MGECRRAPPRSCLQAAVALGGDPRALLHCERCHSVVEFRRMPASIYLHLTPSRIHLSTDGGAPMRRHSPRRRLSACCSVGRPDGRGGAAAAGGSACAMQRVGWLGLDLEVVGFVTSSPGGATGHAERAKALHSKLERRIWPRRCQRWSRPDTAPGAARARESGGRSWPRRWLPTSDATGLLPSPCLHRRRSGCRRRGRRPVRHRCGRRSCPPRRSGLASRWRQLGRHGEPVHAAEQLDSCGAQPIRCRDCGRCAAGQPWLWAQQLGDEI
jgi:hypothetical protein